MFSPSALSVAVANGGPGTGNGVVGGAAAFVLGLIGVATAGSEATASPAAEYSNTS